MSRCMCGAEDCASCHPEAFVRIGGRNVYIGDKCEVCDGTGHIPCADCEFADCRDPDTGDCTHRDEDECPECPECHGQTAADEARERRWERDED